MNFKETFLDLIGSLRNIMKDDAVVTKICHRSFENSEAIFRQLQKRHPWDLLKAKINLKKGNMFDY